MVWKRERAHLSFYIDVELLDTLQGKLLFLHQDAHGLTHELRGHVQDLSGHGGRKEHHLKADPDVMHGKIPYFLSPTPKNNPNGLHQEAPRQLWMPG